VLRANGSISLSEFFALLRYRVDFYAETFQDQLQTLPLPPPPSFSSSSSTPPSFSAQSEGGSGGGGTNYFDDGGCSGCGESSNAHDHSSEWARLRSQQPEWGASAEFSDWVERTEEMLWRCRVCDEDLEDDEDNDIVKRMAAHSLLEISFALAHLSQVPAREHIFPWDIRIPGTGHILFPSSSDSNTLAHLDPHWAESMLCATSVKALTLAVTLANVLMCSTSRK